MHEQVAGVRDAFRSRLRTVRRLLRQVHRISRQHGEAAAEQQRTFYVQLLETTRQTVRQAERVQVALATAFPPMRPAAPRATAVATPRPTPVVERAARRIQTQLARFLPLVGQVIAQAQARVVIGHPVPSLAKGLSLFEPHTRVVKRAKAGAAVEFGRQVVFDEVEGGLVTRFHVLTDDESECHQALPAVQHHRAVFGHPPWLVTGDRRVHTRGVEDTAQSLGVTHVVIPWTGSPSPAQRAREQQRSWRRRSWRRRSWRRRYRWQAGIEGRIHSLRRDYGLARSRSHGVLVTCWGWNATWAGACWPATCATSPPPKPGGLPPLPDRRRDAADTSNELTA